MLALEDEEATESLMIAARQLSDDFGDLSAEGMLRQLGVWLYAGYEQSFRDRFKVALALLSKLMNVEIVTNMGIVT